MKISYLFSGIDKEKGFNEVQAKYLKKDIKNNSNIIFIATIFDNFEKNDEQYNKIVNLIGGILMIIMGILLIFKPEWIMLNF